LAKRKAKSGGPKWVGWLLMLAVLAGLFVFAGFWGPGPRTFLEEADERLGTSIFQGLHDRLFAAVAGSGPDKSPAPPDASRPASPAAPSPPAGRIIEEKRPSGQVIQRLEKLGDPLGDPAAEDGRQIETIIEKSEQKKD